MTESSEARASGTFWPSSVNTMLRRMQRSSREEKYSNSVSPFELVKRGPSENFRVSDKKDVGTLSAEKPDYLAIKNDDLWSRAQESDQLRNDKRWKRLTCDFDASSGALTIEKVVAGFEAAARTESGRGREILYTVIDFARDSKDFGSSVATLDPTHHATAVWGCLQLMITVSMNLHLELQSLQTVIGCNESKGKLRPCPQV